MHARLVLVPAGSFSAGMPQLSLSSCDDVRHSLSTQLPPSFHCRQSGAHNVSAVFTSLAMTRRESLALSCWQRKISTSTTHVCPWQVLDPTKEATYTFLGDFLEEMTTVFTDSLIYLVRTATCLPPQLHAHPLQQLLHTHPLQPISTVTHTKSHSLSRIRHCSIEHYREVSYRYKPRHKLQGGDEVGFDSKCKWPGSRVCGYHCFDKVQWHGRRHAQSSLAASVVSRAAASLAMVLLAPLPLVCSQPWL